ncbi:MAG TPA: tRNA (adenosine(37)-N6)-threonylcarbamoyltransferase complex ATPase subunit type 1 TsaE [Candidatus Andersenbacteria bacterium]|nr:tRNA (adenosine(37)-N6)-threonylcarbamoyltransferase complex ATPase subunit type 1 TsaE [Candidatus Andersenbacteria bacterium]
MIEQLTSLDELSALAMRIARELRAGDVLLLQGELGAGKTTFTQFLGKELGVQDNITSPTFTLIGEYPTFNNPTISTFIHIDLYRTGQQTALNNNYIQEVLESAKEQKAIVVIEWGELLNSEITNRTWRIAFKQGAKENDRVVTISKSFPSPHMGERD